MKTISVKLTPELDARLSAVAARRHITKSKLIRQVLDDHLEHGGAVEESVLDRIRDLVGSVRGGPADLSTNPKYMKDFGK